MADNILRFVRRFIPRAIFNFLQPIYHWKLALLAAIVYRFPSRRLKVVGITGTSGKTTTAEMLFKIFSDAGIKSATINSLNFRILNELEQNMLKMTTPGRFRVQRFLRRATNSGCEYVFLEMTSEGIKQSRHKFIKFYAAIFTNLSEEHLESHGGFENYRAAKAELFKIAPLAILNGDDPNFEYFYKIAPKEKIVFVASDYPAGLELKITGDFNKMNAVASMAFARREGISLEVSKKALSGLAGLPGRMEWIDPPAGGRINFKVLVDYAFIPKAMEKVYETLYAEGEKNLICVFGAAGGGRDAWKRPIMGDIAAKFGKKVIVTNEDPYDEDPMKIMNEVAGSHNFEKILDRRVAIRRALKSAKAGDVVIITGKGAEPWIMGPNGSKLAWDDRKIVREEVEKL